MEEYLQHMKTLRSHMNDAEDLAATVTVDEQRQITTIQTLTKDIDLAKSETRRLKEDGDLMLKTKGQICSQILERQRKIALLENDSFNLVKTLELIQQERVNSSTKLLDKRTFYGKTEDEINTKLKEQQNWLDSYKQSSEAEPHGLVNAKVDQRPNRSAGKYDAKTLAMSGNPDDAYKDTMKKFDAAKAKFDMLIQMRSKLTSESRKVKQLLEKLKCKMDNFKPEVRDMPGEKLREELEALVSDKSGETEFQQSMQNQIDTVKGISQTIKCGCGEEYKVQVDDLRE